MEAVNVYSYAAEGEKKISEHFRVREFRCKDGSDPVFVAPSLVDLLEKGRAILGAAIHINSGYRTVSHNAKQKGASPKSQHLYGHAVDIWVEGRTPEEVYDCFDRLMPDSGGVGIYSDRVHVDDRTVKSRWDYR